MRKVLFILGQLTDDDVEWLVTHGRRETVSAGTVLIREGEPTAAMYIVLDGRMSVRVGGDEVARIGAGETVGEMSFVDRSPPAASVEALEPCRVLRLEKAALEARTLEDPAFGMRLYKAIATFLSDRLRGTVRRMGFGGPAGDDDGLPEGGELDLGVLENVHLAGARFDRMVRRLAGDD